MLNITTWEYSVETEAKRLIQCAYQIIIGFYKINNFIVLPYKPDICASNIVIFPLISYIKIPRFWDRVRKSKVVDLPVVTDQDLINKIILLLNKMSVNKPNFIKTKIIWEKAQKEIISEIYKIIPCKKNVIKNIVIYPTSFGTNCSFNLVNKKGEIIIYLRKDQGIHAITEAIITSLTRSDIYEKLEGLWQESEIITDFLMTQTSVAKVLQKYEKINNFVPTLKGVRIKEQAKLLIESNKFYQELGIPSFEKPFSYNGLVPELFGKNLNNLSEVEKKLLLNLIKNSNNITTMEEIGNIIFKSEEDFSLYAISKTIQRLRDKLEANGISGSYIQTLRSKGYLLKN